jgi:hypothetical protein
LIIGSSTARPLDPQELNAPFGARFANLSINASSAREQQAVFEYFARKLGPPKVLLIGLDHVWCKEGAEMRPGVDDFPEHLYDDNPWNDLLPMFNTTTLELAGRLIGNRLGLYPERIRSDGFDATVRSEQEYRLAQAQAYIWEGRPPRPVPDLPPPQLSDEQRHALRFTSLDRLDRILAALPQTSLKILLFTPAHAAIQAWPGTQAAAVEAECKARVVAMARKYSAKVVDWRRKSAFTTNDSNYWDALHYRISAARIVAHETARAVLDGRESPDGSYRLLAQ